MDSGSKLSVQENEPPRNRRILSSSTEKEFELDTHYRVSRRLISLESET